MKSKLLSTLLLVLFVLTSTALAAPTPIIKADKQRYDVNTGLYLLEGNVYIEVNNRIITANMAKVSMSSLEVWASGGVTVTQGDIYFTGSNVYVYGLHDRAQIDGGVHFSRTNLTITADKTDFNWRSKVGVFSGNVIVTQNGVTSSADTVNYNVETNTIF